jgi:transglutaminase-like putative cysteine protease
MTARDPAPRGLRRFATVCMFAATILALANLPGDELPVPWLLAFTLPGAILGGWSRLARSPWRRAAIAVILQAGACWTALEWVGPMTRPAALACTILPPLAFATARNHDADPSLALFLSFCVLLVGIILDGLHIPLLLGYGAAAFLSLHGATLLHSYRTSTPRKQPAPLRALDVNAVSLMVMSCILAVFAIDRTLSCLPSPSRGSTSTADGGDFAGNDREVGLDDTFSFDGTGGVLSELRGEQLVRAESPDGPVSDRMYLRCGFFTVPGLDRWDIGQLNLRPQSSSDGHVFRRPSRFAATNTLVVERYAGAAKFVFLPPHTTQVRGLEDLVVDTRREWIRPRSPNSEPYEVLWQEFAPLPAGAQVDRRARLLGMLSLPPRLDRVPFEELLSKWRVGRDPMQAMEALADGLARHCRYDRSAPIGPYPHELENFLFADEDRHGYCMHFASAAALMLRMRGIPCRIGVGLYGGEPSREGPDVRIYGSQHAHAWVEVPFEGRGYVIFDPTPPGARGRSFVPDSRPAIESDPDVEVERPFFEPAVRAVTDVVTTPWTWAIVLGAVLLLAVLPRRAPKPPERAYANVAPKARRALQKLMRALAHAGHRRGHGQTLELFAQDLDRRARLQPEVKAAFAAYQEVRFGGREFDDEHASTMEQGIRAAVAMQPPAPE